MSIFDDIKKDRETGTPGLFRTGDRHSDNSVYSQDGETLVANTHGSQRNFDRDQQLAEQDANARRIARVPQLEAIALAAEELAGHFENLLDCLGFLCGHDYELEGFGISEKDGLEIRKALADYRKAVEDET
jgi:hypothetical protein